MHLFIYIYLNYLFIHFLFEYKRYYPSEYPSLLLAAGSGLNANVSTIYDTLQNFNTLFQTAIGELDVLSSTPEKTICLAFLQTA